MQSNVLTQAHIQSTYKKEKKQKKKKFTRNAEVHCKEYLLFSQGVNQKSQYINLKIIFRD